MDDEDVDGALESAEESGDALESAKESGDELESAEESMLLSSDAEALKDLVDSCDDDDDEVSLGGEASSCEASSMSKTLSEVKQLTSSDDDDDDDVDTSVGGGMPSVEAKQHQNDEVSGDYWNPEEKALLLAFVKQFGMLNLDALAAVLKTKNVQQIRDFFTKVTRAVSSDRTNRARRRTQYRMARERAARSKFRRSRNYANTTAKQKKKWKQMLAAEVGEGPIDWWLTRMEAALDKKLKQSSKNRKSVQNPQTISNMIPRACLIISQYEDHPDPSQCAGVNYKEAYDYLYHILSGVPPKSMSAPTAAFIQRSIERLRNSMLDGMYSLEFSKYFGAQVNHIKSAVKPTRQGPMQTYGAPPKNPAPSMTEARGLPSPTESMERLMTATGFNLMQVPESLTFRLGGHKSTSNKSVPRRRHDLTKEDIPCGIFSETEYFEGLSKTD